MATITNLETQIATYLGRDSVADLTQNGQDIGLYALNSARRRAEQAHDFVNCEVNASLTIASSGSPLNAMVTNNTVTITGTLSPNVAGSWTFVGTRGGSPLYTIRVSSVDYFLSYAGGQWAITTAGFALTSNFWQMGTLNSGNPAGSYTAVGTNTGTPVVANASSGVIVKRVKYVSLPLSSGEYEPIEFLTSDEQMSRTRKAIGRQPFNASKSLVNLGVSTLGNPLAYQNGQMLFLSPSTLAFPITAQVSVVQFMPDYVNSGSTDWFVQLAPEFLYWCGILEANYFFKRFTDVRIEGQINETEVQGYADKALASLIAWDESIVRGTSTPQSQMQGPPVSTPVPQSVAA